MTFPLIEPLALGERVVAILQLGRRTATYKLATLMALMEHCIEHLPDDPAAELVIEIREVAERVLELYWHQVLPFEGGPLRQSTQPIATILRDVRHLRDKSGSGDRRVALAVARLMTNAVDLSGRFVEDVNGCWSVVVGDGVVFLFGFLLSCGAAFDDSRAGSVSSFG